MPINEVVWVLLLIATVHLCKDVHGLSKTKLVEDKLEPKKDTLYDVYGQETNYLVRGLSDLSLHDLNKAVVAMFSLMLEKFGKIDTKFSNHESSIGSNTQKVANLESKITGKVSTLDYNQELSKIESSIGSNTASIKTNTDLINNIVNKIDNINNLKGNDKDVRDDCLNITNGHLSRIYQEWGDVYSIEFEITVNKMSKSTAWQNVFQFAVGGASVSRIPAFNIRTNGAFHFSTSLSGNRGWGLYHSLEVGKPTQIAIKQVKDGSQYWFEITKNGKTIFKEEQLDPFRFSNVYLYESYPSSKDAFTAEFGSICNVTISGGVSSGSSGAITSI